MLVNSCSSGKLEVENQILYLENRELKEEIRLLKESIENQSKPTSLEQEKNLRKMAPQKSKGNIPPKFSM
jgi:hypothetical protein